MIDKTFWKNKTVLVTGHTGFKGSWLSIWLNEMGVKVIGYGLEPYTDRDNFVLSNISQKIIDVKGDIRDSEKLQNVFKQYKPEIVFHLAAQPLVILSYEQPKQTYETNVIGTLNVLECIRTNDYTKVGVMITTDKCYENKEQIWGYRENEAFGGYDPYSSSKACAEILISSYRNSYMNPNNYNKHGKSIASVRAGNVIGGGDWSKDRIIPDCIRAIEANKPIKIRNPEAVRPWQHVLEPLSGYIMLAEKMYNSGEKYAEGWNFGPNLDSIITVWEMGKILIEKYQKGILEDISNKDELHEAKLLSLDIAKARFILGWKPKMNIEQTIEMTVDWYKRYREKDIYDLCTEHIEEYVNKE